MPFHSICLIGASGNLGTLILKHLLASPQKFQIKVLSRQSSTATFPDSVTVTRVPDDYPAEQLEQAFRGVDVVVAAVSMLGMGEQYKFIDACVAANVKRYFPTEFGLDDLPDWLLQLREMFKIKHDVRDYCVARESAGLEWTSVCCNAFFEMGVASGFFQLHWKEKKAVLLDGGDAKFVATTLDTVAVAVVRAIERPDVSRNRILLVQDFRTSQREILDAVQQRVPGWEVQIVESGPWLESGKEAVRKGDNSQLPKLTFGTFGQGNQYEGRPEYANDVLELPTKSFSEAMDMFWNEYKGLVNA
ncbi:NmrA-like family protein [Cladophialophora carrionii]|uniref:NmrA-like family protein n=1 Tax=Cladophialophora carrionii TaxID=86049 RepID=A0A1C1C9N7_9EURO|nr:NmrA-like family protein [Cladophialophora carrionii]